MPLHLVTTFPFRENSYYFHLAFKRDYIVAGGVSMSNNYKRITRYSDEYGDWLLAYEETLDISNHEDKDEKFMWHDHIIEIGESSTGKGYRKMFVCPKCSSEGRTGNVMKLHYFKVCELTGIITEREVVMCTTCAGKGFRKRINYKDPLEITSKKIAQLQSKFNIIYRYDRETELFNEESYANKRPLKMRHTTFKSELARIHILKMLEDRINYLESAIASARDYPRMFGQISDIDSRAIREEMGLSATEINKCLTAQVVKLFLGLNKNNSPNQHRFFQYVLPTFQQQLNEYGI
jgi:hypothetical protein